MSVFELERFSAAPVSGDVAVVEVGGRFGNGDLNGDTPRLLVESIGGARIELPALGPISGPAGRWQASFAVPADQLDGSFALALRDVLLDLPAPDTTGGDGDRLIALARELNALRRALDDAEADKDRALTDAAARMETSLREAARARQEVEAEAVTLRERADRSEAQHAALEEELREARRVQKTHRAELEALRRERDGLAKALAKAAPPEPAPADDAATAIAEAVDLEGPAVKVIGRESPRRAAPTEVIDAELPPAPPILGYLVAAIIFVIFVVVVMLLLV